MKELPEAASSIVPELKVFKPVIDSVSFHRYGKEFAITVTGNNLWFCNKVKISSFSQDVSAEDTSQKSLQFNCSVDNGIAKIPTTSNHVSVKIWSHFSGAVDCAKVPVKHKVWKQSTLY